MNLDELPYEAQFKYLANLCFQDIMRYCQPLTDNITAYNICQTKAFWQYKARETFNLNLDIIDGIKSINSAKTSSAEKYRELETLCHHEPTTIIRYLVQVEDLTAVPTLLKEVASEKFVLIDEVLDIVIGKDSSMLLEAVLNIFKLELEELTEDGEIQDVMRHHYIDAAVRNKMDLVNILRRYYDPNEDHSEYLDEWISQWLLEADPTKLKLLIAAGVPFNRVY